jgi:hypothetical protein
VIDCSGLEKEGGRRGKSEAKKRRRRRKRKAEGVSKLKVKSVLCKKDVRALQGTIKTPRGA